MLKQEANGKGLIMKILLAVESENNHKDIANQPLRLLGRVGYQSKIFVPVKQQKKYYRAVEDCNYNWYTAIPRTSVLAGQTADDHAKRNKFDLIVRVPDNLDIPVERKAEQRYIIAFCKKLELARAKFNSGEYKKKRTLGAGVTVERI